MKEAQLTLGDLPLCADDGNIYMLSKAARERAPTSATRFPEDVLRLRVNRAKSAAAHRREGRFLGRRLLEGGRLSIAPKSLERAKERMRRIARRNRGISFERMICELNSFLTGWVTYFRQAAYKTQLKGRLDWSQAAGRVVEAIPTDQDHRRLPAPARRACEECVAPGGCGEGLVATGGQSIGKACHDRPPVRVVGLVSLVQRYVTLQAREKPPATTESARWRGRERGREVPAYPIDQAHCRVAAGRYLEAA